MPRRTSSAVTTPKPLPPSIQVQQPSLMQTVKEGFAFGAGSSIAHSLINRYFNNIGTPTEKVKPCESYLQAYDNCIINDTAYCGDKRDEYRRCMQEK